jgi:hypothetical protein
MVHDITDVEENLYKGSIGPDCQCFDIEGPIQVDSFISQSKDIHDLKHPTETEWSKHAYTYTSTKGYVLQYNKGAKKRINRF